MKLLKTNDFGSYDIKCMCVYMCFVDEGRGLKEEEGRRMKCIYLDFENVKLNMYKLCMIVLGLKTKAE